MKGYKTDMGLTSRYDSRYLSPTALEPTTESFILGYLSQSPQVLESKSHPKGVFHKGLTDLQLYLSDEWAQRRTTIKVMLKLGWILFLGHYTFYIKKFQFPRICDINLSLTVTALGISHLCTSL